MKPKQEQKKKVKETISDCYNDMLSITIHDNSWLLKHGK